MPMRPSKKARTEESSPFSSVEASEEEDRNSPLSISSSGDNSGYDDGSKQKKTIFAAAAELDDSDEELAVESSPSRGIQGRLSPIWKQEDVEALAPKKRGRGRPKKDKEAEVEQAPRKNMYSVEFFSCEQMEKPKSKRDLVCLSFELSDDEPWDTFKAQFLAKLNNKVKNAPVDYDEYEVLFYIPRLLPKPGLDLSDQDAYSSLVSRGQSVKANPTIQLTVTQHPPSAPDSREGVAPPLTQEASSQGGAEKAKKKVVSFHLACASVLMVSQKKEKGPLPGNVARAEAIQTIQACWVCPGKTRDCDGRYCYIFPEGHQYAWHHCALNNPRLECWGGAMIKGSNSETGEIIATADFPPNHPMYDGSHLLPESPVVARRAEMRRQDAAAQAAQAAQTANSGGNRSSELQDLTMAVLVSTLAGCVPLAEMGLNLPAMALAAPQTLPAPQSQMTASSSTQIKLLGPGFSLSADMSVSEFGRVFDVSDETINKLDELKFTKVRLLRFLEEKDLVNMGLAAGQRAELIDALKSWSKASAAE
ncbi:hypothetical protein NMY22_g15666 [Coprinellus aureogranulatus]|nr:hypothetical protein NMY22_g15666 [Coprinellus aureogranulatus]